MRPELATVVQALKNAVNMNQQVNLAATDADVLLKALGEKSLVVWHDDNARFYPEAKPERFRS